MMPRGDNPLSEVFKALHNQVIKQTEDYPGQLDRRSDDNVFPPASKIDGKELGRNWSGPSSDAITSGIALSVLFDVVLREGQLFAKDATNQMVAMPRSEHLFLEMDPPSVPIVIRNLSTTIIRLSDAYSFCEFGPSHRVFSFVKSSNWSVRNSPSFVGCQSAIDEETVRSNWLEFSDLAGAELYFRSSVSFREGKPITPSQIAQRHRSAINTIARGRVPRSNSLLYEIYVEEVARHINIVMPRQAEELSIMNAVPRRAPEITLPLLASIDVILSHNTDKTNRGLRTLKRKLIEYYQSNE